MYLISELFLIKHRRDDSREITSVKLWKLSVDSDICDYQLCKILGSYKQMCKDFNSGFKIFRTFFYMSLCFVQNEARCIVLN